MNSITLLTRRSPLAMWQAEAVRDQLQRAHPELTVTISGHSTGGDREQKLALQDVGGKDLFATDLRKRILPGIAAVHSLKDLSVKPQPTLSLAATLKRATPTDALISTNGTLGELPTGARIGTASPRRRSQLLAHRPDLNCQLIRGNVGTRLAKLDEGQFDAIVLATCGLERLGLAHRITEQLDPTQFVPAIAQAVVGIECLSDDQDTINLLKPLHCTSTGGRVQAERAFNQYLEGDCFSAIAAHAQHNGDSLFIRGYVGSLDGKTQLRGELSGPANSPADLGLALAKQLEAQGARELLNTGR
jgi:hydroxymethylbilane synthase